MRGEVVVVRGGEDAVEPGLVVVRARSGEGTARQFLGVQA